MQNHMKRIGVMTGLKGKLFIDFLNSCIYITKKNKTKSSINNGLQILAIEFN